MMMLLLVTLLLKNLNRFLQIILFYYYYYYFHRGYGKRSSQTGTLRLIVINYKYFNFNKLHVSSHFLTKHKNGFEARKSHKTRIFPISKGHICDTRQAPPVMLSVTPDLSPTAITYSILYLKSTLHDQNFSYVTRAHPDISWGITQYLNLGNVLRRSPLDLIVILQRANSPCVVFSFFNC